MNVVPIRPDPILHQSKAQPESAPAVLHPLMAVAPLFLLILTSHMASARVFPPPAKPGTAETPPADNRALYNTSSQFCLGCIAESMEFLLAHNWARSQHLELPLIWDFEVEKYARWWASERKSDCKLQHSFDNGTFVLGENIFWGSGSGWSPRDAVRAWVDEQKYFSYSSNQCLGGHVCGHYTQVVWRETRRIGCSRVVCDTGDVFMTCNYDPPGNYIGQRPY